jgi:hypothetical protein
MLELSEFIHILDHDIMNRTPVGTKQSILNSFRYVRVSEFIHILDHDIMNRTPVGTKQSILNSFRYE